MVSKDEWGRATWNFIHHMVNALKEERTDLIQPILNIIRNICRNLPCPECSDHATILLNRLNLNSIRTKRDLVRCMYEFHNKVNVRIKKREITLEEHESQYQNVNIQATFMEWKRIMQIRMSGNRMLLYSISKNRLKTDVTNFFNTYKNAFILFKL
jgi:hypothetical protein